MWAAAEARRARLRGLDADLGAVGEFGVENARTVALAELLEGEFALPEAQRLASGLAVETPDLEELPAVWAEEVRIALLSRPVAGGLTIGAIRPSGAIAAPRAIA